MREIKFRGLTKSGNKLVIGDLIHSPHGESRIIWFEEKEGVPLGVDYRSFNEAIQSETIGQFTGLKDKNGVEIYEGDIIEGTTFSYKKLICKVIYDNKYGCYQLESFREKPLTFPIKAFLRHLEVIGNIHENPDLL